MKLEPDKLRIVTVKGPRFAEVIRSAQQYMARIVIKKLDEKPEEVAADK